MRFGKSLAGSACLSHQTAQGLDLIIFEVPANPWKIPEIDGTIVTANSQYLSRADVRKLIQHLQAWVDTGSLELPPEVTFTPPLNPD